MLEIDDKLAMAADGKPYTTLGYGNGPGSVVPPAPEEAAAKTDGDQATLASATAPAVPLGREDLTSVDTAAADFHQQATVPLKSETHRRRGRGDLRRGPLRAALRRRGGRTVHLPRYAPRAQLGLTRAAGAPGQGGGH